MTKIQLMDLLDARDIVFKVKSTKAELIALLEG
jgi:hypothetical protein